MRKVAAHSCTLCNHQMELLIVDKEDYEGTYDKLQQFVEVAADLERQNK